VACRRRPLSSNVRVNVSKVPSDERVSFADRGATAVLSFVAALGTVACAAFVLLFYGPSSVEVWKFFSFVAAGLIVIAPIVGFVVGSERAARGWGVLWGTEDPETWQVAVATSIIVLICGGALYAYWPA